MAVRDRQLSGDPRLRQPSRAVPASQCGGETLLALVQDLRDTMAARDGAGLAAPQIGVPESGAGSRRGGLLERARAVGCGAPLAGGCATQPSAPAVNHWCGRWTGSMPAWCNTNAITWRAFCSPIGWAEPQQPASP
jgi:hypothetical protein